MKIQKEKINNYGYVIFRSIIIWGLAFIIIYPLLVRVSSSLMAREDLYDLTVNWIPKNPSLDAFFISYDLLDYPVSLFNTTIIVVVISITQLLSCTIVGYGFARYDFRGKNIWFALVILSLLIPPQVIMIPFYLNFRFFTIWGLLPEPGINLLGSIWPFIFLSLTSTGLRNGLYIYIIRQYFSGMSKSLEEAAYVDGAGALRTFFQVMLPHAVPAMVTVLIFSVVWQWNDLFYFRLFLPKANILPYALESIARAYETEYAENLDVVFTGIDQYTSVVRNSGMLLFIAPLIVFYSFLQRYFIESIENTGIVG
ncbi:MAG: carbohydrate ABC transporter permease [Halothermotrichaceae bacterium]